MQTYVTKLSTAFEVPKVLGLYVHVTELRLIKN